MRWPLASLLLLSALTACDDDGPPVPGPVDGGARDAAAADASAADDASIRDAEPQDSGADGGTSLDATVVIDSRGFPIRVPQTRLVPCMGRGGCSDGCDAPMIEATDTDFVCTLRHGARDRHFVYVQSRPVRLDPGLGFFPLPTYERDGAWVSDGAQLVASEGPGVYDYGGGHHNDSMTIDLGDVVYRYYHSSFGFGFRKCQEMDCLQVFAPGAATPTTDGCTRDRTLPVVCVKVASDGTVPELMDTFMRCPGDT